MSRWLERTARRLADPGDGSAPSSAPERASITRRQSIKAAGGAALAASALATISPTDAEAGFYCYATCVNNAGKDLQSSNDRLHATALKGIVLLPAGLAYVYYQLAQNYSKYYQDRASCNTPYCGSKTLYPPPNGGGTGGGGSGGGTGGGTAGPCAPTTSLCSIPGAGGTICCATGDQCCGCASGIICCLGIFQCSECCGSG